jgi:dolichol-phosphate mannosyltransferase
MSAELNTSGWQVPEHRTYTMSPRTSRYVVMIPVINEGQRITNQLARIKALNCGIDVVIADGGSTDGTADPDLLAGLGVRALLVKTGAGKLSAQMRMGFAFLMKEGYEGIIMVDGNGKDGVEAIPSFAKKLDEGYDLVQGSRYVPGGAEKNTPWVRSLGIRLVHAPLTSFAARFWYTDTTNGFRAYSRRMLLSPKVQPFREVFNTYNLHFYLSVKTPRLGFRVLEIPVTRFYPDAGPTPTKIKGVHGNFDMLNGLLQSMLGTYDPPSE